MNKILTIDLIKLYKSKYKIDVSSFFKAEYISLKKMPQGYYRYKNCLPGDISFYKNYYHFLRYSKNRFEFKVLNKMNTQNKKILDIGAGAGYLREYIKGKYIGVDQFSNKNSILKKSFNEFFSLNNETYDIICCFQVLEHVAEPIRFLELLLNKLNPDGILYLSVPNNDSYKNKEFNSLSNMPPHHLTLWNLDALKNVFTSLNAKVSNSFIEPGNIRPYLVNTLMSAFTKKRISSNSLLRFLHFFIKVFLFPLKVLPVSNRFPSHTLLIEVRK